MIRGIDASSERYLHDLSRIEDRLTKTQREIATGVRVSQASDDPDQVMNILQLRADLERADTIEANLGRVKAEVDTAESAIQVAIKLVERARVLGAETAASAATNRLSVKTEVEQIQQQLINLGYTMSEGRYIFSGDADNQMLARRDWTTSPPTEAAVSTRVVEDINGVTFHVGKTAHELFDAGETEPADGNVLAALDQLIVALGHDSAEEVQATMPKLEASLEHLNRQLTFYGQSQNRLDDAITLTKKVVLTRTEELSRAQDADLTSAIVNLNTAAIQQQAALGAHARIPRESLFDYLA